MRYSLGIYLKINCFQYQKAGNSNCYGLLASYKNIKYFNLKDLEKFFSLLYYKKYSMRRPDRDRGIFVRKTKILNKLVVYRRTISQPWNYNYLQKSVFEILPYETK